MVCIQHGKCYTMWAQERNFAVEVEESLFLQINRCHCWEWAELGPRLTHVTVHGDQAVHEHCAPCSCCSCWKLTYSEQNLLIMLRVHYIFRLTMSNLVLF